MAAILRVKDENGNIVSIPAIKGDKGEKGDKGDRGLPGSGGVPDGGTTGQVLTKNSNADGDAGWKDAVQADWNENDDSSPAFVKNRTHYTEYENQFQFDYNEDSHSYAITFSVALDTDKTYELVYDYDIENDAGVQATTLIKWKVINPVTYKGSWVGKFTQKTKYGSTFWCFNDIHPADSSLLPCIYSSDMKTFTGLINSCVNNEAWLNEVKIAVPLDLKYIPETIARASDTVMGTGEEQHFGSAVEEQICSNIGALYRDDLNGYLSDKVDKNQGTANSGKFLGIGADGIVVPTEVGGGSGGSDRLIAKYVHSGNPVIQPTALDLTTGVFTCAGHELTTGDRIMIIPDGSFTSIPFELCSTLMNSTTTLSVRVIDDDTFVIRNSANTDITYPNTVNTSVDVTKWHIEKSSVQVYTIDGFSANEIKILLSGFAWGTSNFYPFVFAKDSNGVVGARYNNNIGSTTGNDCMITPFYDIECIFSNKMKMDVMYLNSPTTEADYKYLQSYPQFMGYNSRSKGKTTSQMYALRDHTAFTAITIMSSTQSVNLNLMLANGFTVEVYKLG